MDDSDIYRSMLKESLRTYFDTNYDYVEEFDTPDGTHHIWRIKPKYWNPDILQAAMDLGLVPK